jgi:nitroreductase
MNHSYIQSTGAYIQNILLCATDLGVGSLWVNDILFYKDEISEYVKETDLLVSGVLLGKCRTNVDHASLTKQENFYVYRK